MPDHNDPADTAAPDAAPAETATQKLAALVARKKLGATGGGHGTKSDNAQAERQAAARSVNKSKPALRK